MDAVLTRYTAEQSIATGNYQQISSNSRNNKNNAGRFVSNASQNFNNYGGLLHAPAYSVRSFSYPISSTSVYINSQHPQSPQQPPLLPLPISAVQQPLVSLSLNRGLSCPAPTNRKNRTRHPSLTPKKSKREEVKRDLKSDQISDALDNNRLGPDPNNLPKHIPLVLSHSASMLMGKDVSSLAVENIETSYGSIFNLAPPPSSLPLPKFSLRPKLGCKAQAQAQAAGVDTGATDNLRRILRLR